MEFKIYKNEVSYTSKQKNDREGKVLQNIVEISYLLGTGAPLSSYKFKEAQPQLMSLLSPVDCEIREWINRE